MTKKAIETEKKLVPVVAEKQIEEIVKKTHSVDISIEEFEVLEKFRARNKEKDRRERLESIKQMQLGEAREEALEEARLKDNVPVTGIFKHNEVPGGILKFNFRKYKKDGVVPYSLRDGDRVTIPLMVANHLNETCSYPVHVHTKDAAGRPSQKIGRMISRVDFFSRDFGADPMGEIGPRPDFLTVTNI